MVVQLTPVTPPGRKIRVNTVAFDVECVMLITDEPQGHLAIVNGFAFRKADIDKYFVPHQMANITPATPNTDRFGYLTVVPYGVSYVLTAGTEIDPNLTDNIDNVAVLTPNDEILLQVEHYKHHTGTSNMNESAFTVPVGVNMTAFGNTIYFTPPTLSSYAWSWFNMTSTTEELIVIPTPDISIPYATTNIQILELKVNLGHVVPDCSVRNCIYSTYQVIRGNEYGTRESIIDYPT